MKNNMNWNFDNSYSRLSDAFKEHIEPIAVKNPKNNYAAKLIDEMGLKGFKIGDAEISTIHSNFIINTSSASSKDIYELITVIQQKVLQKKGIYLQPEVRMIGFDYPN